MKVIFIILCLVARVATQTFWFNVGISTDRAQAGVIGANQQTVVKGERFDFKGFSIDWEAGAATEEYQITLANHNKIESYFQVGGDEAESIVYASKSVFRFNGLSGGSITPEEYPTATQGSNAYAKPSMVKGTLFAFVSSLSFSANHRFYRIYTDRISGVKEFTVTANSEANGLIQGTNLVHVSLIFGNRLIFDYTNGYIGGTNSPVAEYTKTTSMEADFMSPKDGRGYYVTSSILDGKLTTLKVADGT